MASLPGDPKKLRDHGAVASKTRKVERKTTENERSVVSTRLCAKNGKSTSAKQSASPPRPERARAAAGAAARPERARAPRPSRGASRPLFVRAMQSFQSAPTGVLSLIFDAAFRDERDGSSGSAPRAPAPIAQIARQWFALRLVCKTWAQVRFRN